MNRRLPAPSVLIVTDRRQLAGGAGGLGPLADTAFAGGCRWISLREKDLDADAQVELARDLKRRAAAVGGRVTVHGAAEIALRAGVDGVHLPEAANAAAARAVLGEDALIGQSVHTPEQARDADPAHLDYIIAGPAFATASKPGYGPWLGATGLAVIVQAARVPVIAIGGIDANSAPVCLAAGAAGVAVMGGVMRAADPAAEVRALIAALG
ncbi:thiamine-phosphate pyrophosphorylase [Pseudochelatococcus lubricantis]|uniref:Thiamine-phosphate pyrophosphorylase n=1 Tax=Pseudochelatococcus lubricantis TaxID=1538102 RepID=A0ABX0UV28_9HYPH|nr:thiamine-phosphate pyrophosphorylase [Pseudochelatococcus lubricantis]